MKHIINNNKYPSGATGRIAILYEIIRHTPYINLPLHIHYSDTEYYNTYHQRAVSAICSHNRSLSSDTIVPPHMDTMIGRIEDIPVLAKQIKSRTVSCQQNNVSVPSGENELFDDDDSTDEPMDDDDTIDINDIDSDVFEIKQSNNIPNTTSNVTVAQSNTIKSMPFKLITNAVPANSISNSPGQATQCSICGECDNEPINHTNIDTITRKLHIDADTPVHDANSYISSVTYCYHCSAQSHIICLNNYYTIQQYNHTLLPSQLPSILFRQPQWLYDNIHHSTHILSHKLLPRTLTCPQCNKLLYWPILIDNTFISNKSLRNRVEKLAKHRFIESRDVHIHHAIQQVREQRQKKKLAVESESVIQPVKTKRVNKKKFDINNKMLSQSQQSVDIDSISSDNASPPHKPIKKTRKHSPKHKHRHDDTQSSQQSNDSIQSI